MANPHPIHVFINKVKYELDNPLQTGASLKRLERRAYWLKPRASSAS